MVHLSFWLCPRDPTQFGLLIEDAVTFLSEFGETTHTFPPHMTLLSLNTDSPLQAQECVDQLKHHWSLLLELHPSLVVGETRFKCVYIQVVEPLRAILELRQSLVSLLDLSELPRTFDPHVSLVYGDLSLNVRNKVKEFLQDRMCCLVSEFSSLLLVETQDPDYTQWRILAATSLRTRMRVRVEVS
jgi:2'-5' RNA ligase